MAAEFPHTERFVRTYANQVESEIESRLKGHGKIASGKLYDSIRYVMEVGRSRITLSFLMADYGTYVDKGTKPSKYADMEGKGKGKKSKFITSLQKWCRIKGLPEGLAFPIRKKIWREGLPSTQFFTLPTTRRRKQFEEGVRKNLALDTEVAVKKNIVDSVRSTRGMSSTIKVR
jgi:hypothetical protein